MDLALIAAFASWIDLSQRVDKLNDTVNAIVPHAAADRRTEP